MHIFLNKPAAHVFFNPSAPLEKKEYLGQRKPWVTRTQVGPRTRRRGSAKATGGKDRERQRGSGGALFLSLTTRYWMSALESPVVPAVALGQMPLSHPAPPAPRKEHSLGAGHSHGGALLLPLLSVSLGGLCHLSGHHRIFSLEKSGSRASRCGEDQRGDSEVNRHPSLLRHLRLSTRLAHTGRPSPQPSLSTCPLPHTRAPSRQLP